MITTLQMKPRLCFILIAALCGMTMAPAADAAEFLYTWDASSDSSVTAYGIYQRSGDSPYQRIDEVRVHELDDPSRPSYRVIGLGDSGTFWLAATAISDSNSESDLSNETCITVNGQAVECTDRNKNGGAIIVSCFIRAAEGRLPQKAAGR
jgi:hypothetical protein